MQTVDKRSSSYDACDALDALSPAYTDFSASLCAERSWRNVQPVLLASFVAVSQLLTAQAQQIQALRRELARLHNAMDEEHCVTACSIDDKLACALQPLQQQLADATNASHYDTIVARVFEQTREQFALQQTASAEHLAELDTRLRCSAAEQAERLQHDAEQHQRALDAAQTQALATLQAEQQQWLEHAQQAVERTLASQVQQQVADALANAAAKLESCRVFDNSDVDRLTHECDALEARLSKRLSALRAELTDSINDRPDRSEVVTLLRCKLDAAIETTTRNHDSAVTTQLDELARRLTHAQAATTAELADVRTLSSASATASDVTQLKQNLHDLLSVVESLQHDATAVRAAIADKIDVDDARALVESHTTLVGLERALQQLRDTTSVPQRELARVADQVVNIEQQLRSELLQARYIWKDGRPSRKQTIHWTAQVVNTRTDVFVWRSGASDSVMLKVPGLYHLQVAFFTDVSPTIRVLVNGEPSAELVTDTASPVSGHRAAVERNSSRVRRVHHSAGNIVGLALNAFLALPARAVVQIAYDIDECAQGFLNLRKL